MAFYESVIITRPELTSSQVEDIISNIEEILKSQNGEIKKKENWGLKTLAYKIKKNKKGLYYMINMDCTPLVISELERQLRLNEDIIRFMIIKIEEISDSPSIMIQNQHEKESRTENSSEKNTWFK